MTPAVDELRVRVEVLERCVRRSRMLVALLGTVVVVVALGSCLSHPQKSNVLRARALIIEDERGRDRVVLGAPVPNPSEGERISPSTGLVINDRDGVERFGVGLKDNGSMSMGFDAPPGKGDDRNRERINLIADEAGGSEIRFLDRRTAVVSRLYLGDNNRVWLEFLDFTPDSVVRKRIGFTGEETIHGWP